MSDTISSSSQDYGYGTYQSSSTLTGGTPFTAGSTDNAAGGVAVIEVQPSGGAISVDASSPGVVSSVSAGSGVTSVTTAAFTPPAGGVLVLALVTAAGSLYGTATMSVTDSYGLVWTEAVRANTAGNGYAGIWYAYTPATFAAPVAATLPAGLIGYTYTQTFTATGGFAPYTWALASGSLPPGLTLTAGGALTGIPTTAAACSFTVTVTDSAGNTATSGTQSLTISSSPPMAPAVVASWHAFGVDAWEVSSPSPYWYGTTTVVTNTVNHDWVLVVATWQDTRDSSNAVGYCVDNAHNRYRPIAIGNGNMNTQVWVCPNAKAASRVYVSTSAFVLNLEVTVLDIHGMSAGYSVNAQSSATGSGAGWSMPVTLTEAPCFVLAAGASTAIETTLGSPWMTVTAQATGVSQVVGWQYAAAPGTIACNVGMTIPQYPSSPYSGVIVAFETLAAPVISSPDNPAWPNITVQGAFGYTPGNPTGLPVWTNITSRFLSLSGDRGRSFELDELEAADMVIELDNFDGALSPGGSYGATLITPIQVLADWQGRSYCLFSGLITAIPQTYDFQRSIVKVALSDDFSKLPQVLLPSCMISELLYDNPIHLWPLNDPQGSAQASNWSGRSASILVPVNGKYGPGVEGNTPNSGFGNTAAGSFPAFLEGTQDTCWGNYTGTVNFSYPVPGHPGSFTAVTGYVQGTALMDRDDSTLPLTSTGALYECWALIENDTNNLSSGAPLILLTDEKGANGGGAFFRLVAENTGSVASPVTTLYLTQEGVSWIAIQQLKPPNVFDGHWHHYAVSVTTGGYIGIYLDGNQIGVFHGSFPEGTPNRLVFGGDPYGDFYTGANPYAFGPPGTGAGFFTGMMTNCAVFDRVPDPERIMAHYQSGATGFVGESSGRRIQRVLTWARWAGPQAVEFGISQQQEFSYLGGGYATSGLSGAIGDYSTAGGAAAVDQGAQADVTIQDIANSECGFLFVGADGTLTFRQRDTTMNQATSGALGDMDYALNQQMIFSAGLGLWVNTANCTITTSPAWSYQGGLSALMTVTGTPSSAAVRAEMITAQEAGASMRVMSPDGCYAQAWIDWYGSSGYLSSSPGTITWCPPMTPVLLTAPVASPPGGALTMRFGPDIVSSPPTGTQLYFDHPRLSPAAFQVPYDGDIEIIEDIQYLFNDIAVTRNIDQATFRARDLNSRAQYFPRVYLRTIFTGEGDPSAVVDVANWLLSDYSQPQIRVSHLVVNAAENPEAWEFVLGTDIGDLLSFQRTPVGGLPVQGVFIVLSVSPAFAPDKAEFAYVLAPVTANNILTLDDPVYGLVGGSNELGW